MVFLKWLDKNFEYVCLAILLAIMTILAFANVVLRYCFNGALSWSDEVCCYCLALSAFFCLPCSIKAGSVIRVDTLVNLLGKKTQTIFALICDGLMGLFLVLCIKGGIDIAAKALLVHQKSPALQVPVALFYDITTFCFVLALLRTIQSIYSKIKNFNVQEEGK